VSSGRPERTTEIGAKTGTEPELPLNLFHVLEEEFVALHGPLPETYPPDWDFRPSQVIDAARIIASLNAAAGKLKTSSGRKSFSEHVMTLAAAWRTPLTPEALPAALNALLPVRELYDGAVDVVLRDETREFARVYSRDGRMTLKGDDLRRFNRLLLEDAYSDALARINDVRLAAIAEAIHTAPTPTAALCLSGGGIRSGTFSLGVLQGLAKRNLLEQFHYLSTVSGGGYIGGWLTAWIQRHPKRLDGLVCELNSTGGTKLEPGPEPLRHLREYSNFVAPRVRLISADLWSFVAIYIRNLLINWTALVPLLLGVLLIPRVFVALLYEPANAPLPRLVPWLLLLAGFALSALSVFYITINRPSRADLLVRSPFWRTRGGQGAFLRYSLLPAVCAGVCLSVFWAWRRYEVPRVWWPAGLPGVSLPLLLVLLFLGSLIYVVAIAAARIFVWKDRPIRSKEFWSKDRRFGADVLTGALTGMAGGLLTWIALTTLFADPRPDRQVATFGAAWYTVLAVPAYLLVFFGATTAFVALTSKKLGQTASEQWFVMEDEDREWLARHGGWLLVAALAWVAASGLVIFGPLLLLASPKLISAVGGISGLAAALGGRSALTAANDKDAPGRGWKSIIVENTLAIAAMVFLALIIAALSWVTSWIVSKLLVAGAGNAFTRAFRWVFAYTWTPFDVTGQLALLYFPPAWLLGGLVILAGAVGLLAGWVINLNKFSLHAAYRARIIRAFLGASRTSTDRRPNPFTAFDPQDNIQMHELRPGLLREASFKPGGLTRLVARLKAAEKGQSTTGDLYQELSGTTQSLVARHDGMSPPSPSLTRNLLEDLNRLLDGDPGLLKLPSFAAAASGDTTRALVASILRRRASDPIFSAKTNQELADMLPRHGRPDMMLSLNRWVLDSIYDKELEPLEGPPPPYRLFHVVGAALNLVGGKRLAWQQRRAESFTVSPLHCGSLFRGYRRSRTYGGVDGISLGTAVTISGAAVSSNMGYHSSSAAVTFVLTLFNARLGWWLGNPGAAGSIVGPSLRHAEPPYRRSFPRLSLAPLVMEAFGLTDDTSKYVLLSDGGHFDNLGLYEMVLRRCRFIVVVDGGQDENARFDDLGAAIRKIRIDLGVEIDFVEPVAIYKKDDPKIVEKGRYYAIATIHYPDGGGKHRGVLLYIKPGILGHEPRDVLQYSAANTAFPHQSTIDQLFDESQFESYRRLGEHVVETLCGSRCGPTSFSQFAQAATHNDIVPVEVRELFATLDSQRAPGS
jgi:hypothetical protein